MAIVRLGIGLSTSVWIHVGKSLICQDTTVRWPQADCNDCHARHCACYRLSAEARRSSTVSSEPTSRDTGVGIRAPGRVVVRPSHCLEQEHCTYQIQGDMVNHVDEWS